MFHSFVFREEVGDDNDDDEGMDLDQSKQDAEVAQALAAADALGKGSKGTHPETDSIADALKELDMDNYDEEDDGNSILENCLKHCFLFVIFSYFPHLQMSLIYIHLTILLSFICFIYKLL